jgi:hypothetical protein
MGLVLSRFAISKLAGWDISVKAFIEMAKPLGIDPTTFRVSTGVIILLIVIGYFSSAIFTLFQSKISAFFKVSYINFTMFCNSAGLVTMIGALFSEFLLRDEPKWLLVYIAVGVILFSTINIILLYKKSRKVMLAH